MIELEMPLRITQGSSMREDSFIHFWVMSHTSALTTLVSNNNGMCLHFIKNPLIFFAEPIKGEVTWGEWNNIGCFNKSEPMTRTQVRVNVISGIMLMCMQKNNCICRSALQTRTIFRVLISTQRLRQYIVRST